CRMTNLTCKCRIEALLCFLLAFTMSQAGSEIATAKAAEKSSSTPNGFRIEKQLTHGPRGRILTNTGVWSPDGQWIVYDTRSEAPGESFNGSTIEMVNISTGEIRVVYRSQNGAHCGVVTFHPRENK